MAFTNPKKQKKKTTTPTMLKAATPTVETVNDDDNTPQDKARRSKTQQDTCKSLEEEASPFLQDFIMNRPFTVLALLVIVPYVLRNSYYYLLLQRPDWVQIASLGFIRLRPALGQHDARQVLIVGSMGSNVEQVAVALSDRLDLEMGLETVNAKTDFCRDGTVSTFLGVRFAPRSELESKRDDDRVESTTCAKRIKGSAANAANSFTPQNYASSAAENCSWFDSNCWTRTCQAVLKEQWGCSASADGCITPPFLRVVWHVQHPLRTIQQLVAKVCPRRMKSNVVHPSFRQMAVGFLPESNTTAKTTALSCLETITTYVLNYHAALLDQVNQGGIHSDVRYETSSLCEIVRLAGFLDPSSPLYDASRAAWLDRKCQDDKFDVVLMSSLSSQQADRAVVMPNITWDILEQEMGHETVVTLKWVTLQLGYNTNTESTVTTLLSQSNHTNTNNHDDDDDPNIDNYNSTAASQE